MKGLTLEQMEFLVSKGVTAEEMLAFAKMAGGRSKAAERTARWRAKKAGSVTESVTRDVTSDASPPPNDIYSNPPSVSNETELAAQPKSKPAQGQRGTRLADDFEMPEDWIAWAVSKRGWTRAEAVEEGECFTRYWQAKSGRDACKRDWPKTWQNWVVNSRRQSGVRGNGPGPARSYLQVLKQENEWRRAASEERAA